jgi:hypothetical protein
MKLKKNNIAFIFVLFCLWIFNFNYSHSESYLALGGGISKATGDGSQYWNMGFDIHGEVLGRVSKDIYLVGRIAYNNLTPNEKEYRKELSGIPDLYLDISGSTKILEVTPALRFVLYSNKKIQAFWQLGLGGYLVYSTAEIDVLYSGGFQSFYGEETTGNFGINLGAGIMIGSSGTAEYSIYPMYNILFTRGRVESKYLTVNLSVLFGD